MNDQHTLPTPTLDAERTDQLRTFLTVEAAAGVAAGAHRAPLRSSRRRLAVGGLAAVLLAGGLLASTAVIGSPGSTPADAVAIEEANGWINVRLVDIDADPDAVVEQLRAAGIDARKEDGTDLVAASGARVTSLAVEAPDGTAFGVVSIGPGADLGAVDPGLDAGVVALDETGEVAGPTEGDLAGAGRDRFDGLADLGARVEDDGSISIRSGADVTVVVSSTT